MLFWKKGGELREPKRTNIDVALFHCGDYCSELDYSAYQPVASCGYYEQRIYTLRRDESDIGGTSAADYG
jgi:hypothetical protein